MTIEKILEMLGVEKIDESKQTEVKEYLETIIETKTEELSQNKIEESLNEEKEKLVEEFEQKFEDYKEDVTSKFSNFVDSVLEEEMVIPEKIVKYARLGELYEDLIDQFKVRLAIDEGLLDEEVRNMLGEAKGEIESLRSEVNELTGTKLQLEKDSKDLATHIYLRKKCDGLTENQKTSVMGILEGSSKEIIDKKFDIIIESINSNETKEKLDNVDESGDEKKKEVVEEVIKKSKVESPEELKKEMNDSNNSMMSQWKRMLRENKF